jgi:opacity protein-like surface antigen
MNPMKNSLLALIAGTALIAMSSAAFADGDNCDWKKHRQGHKGMSAEAYEQYKKDHGWSDKEGHGRYHKEDMQKSSSGNQGIKI